MLASVVVCGDTGANTGVVDSPSNTRTTYSVISAPPLSAGAAHDSATWPLPGTPVTPVGAPGTDAGTATGADASDHGPAPPAFTARTWKIHDWPVARPVTSEVNAGADTDPAADHAGSAASNAFWIS